jgi:hypothetical protein
VSSAAALNARLRGAWRANADSERATGRPQTAPKPTGTTRWRTCASPAREVGFVDQLMTHQSPSSGVAESERAGSAIALCPVGTPWSAQ